MRQNNKNKIKILKLATLIAITTITTSCATNNRHKKLANKLIKNNNTILKQIKKERKSEKLEPFLRHSPELMNAERRLKAAINAVIKANDSLKNEFITTTKREVKNEQRNK